MKSTNDLVSIQGKFAPGMQFKGEEIHICHQLIRSLSDNRYLVINSRYRTDILYISDMEKNQSIIRLWCLYKGKTFSENWLNRFFRANRTKDSLEHFFTRLLLLRLMPTWYDLYMNQLTFVLSNETGKIATMINECLDQLASKNIIIPHKTQTDPNQGRQEYSDTLSIVSEVLSKHNLN